MADADDGGWDEPLEQYWSDEDTREENLEKFFKYWLGKHEYIGVYHNLVNLQK